MHICAGALYKGRPFNVEVCVEDKVHAMTCPIAVSFFFSLYDIHIGDSVVGH